MSGRVGWECGQLGVGGGSGGVGVGGGGSGGGGGGGGIGVFFVQRGLKMVNLEKTELEGAFA